MTTRVLAVCLTIGAWAQNAVAETVTWEVFALVSPGRQLLGKGVKSYVPGQDIVVEEQAPGRDGTAASTKSLILSDAFALGASVRREPTLNGFGLLVYRRGDDNGFSWEWFDREEGGVFRRRQGSGRVSVSVKKGAGYEELAAVEFLDDIVLRYLDDMSKPPGTHTHELVITKGSVLKVAP